MVKETFDEIPQVALVPGFISTDKNSGEVTNLGRGGSDYTASIIAASLNAASLEIWTDVDGFMTADPRVISTAYTINELSYVEAMELCNFGAKVVYPPTIYPVCHKNIPILIKNTFNPEAPGTIIKQEVDSGSKAIKGISSINDTTLITVTGLGMVGVIGVNFRIFKALAQNGISVFMVSQASSENSTSIGVRNQDAALACEVLNEEFAKYADVYVATEDGSAGTKGNVLNAIQEKALEADVIFACGPTPMLRALKEYAAANNITCWISMEERMACGIGACLACVCKSKEIDAHSQVHNKRVCKDGPVFLSTEVEL